MKPVHLKLINGDDIIAFLHTENEINYVLRNPLVLDEKEDEYSGRSVIMLAKYVHIPGDDLLTVKKSHVILMSDIPDEFANFYDISLEYNKKVIEPSVLKQIDKAANAMRDILTGNLEPVKQSLLIANNTSIH